MEHAHTEKIKAVVIDDEERARRVMKNLLHKYCPKVKVVAESADVPEGVLQINRHKPDVVFCDIEMPQYSGLELISFFKDVDFEIIFATGYSEFAVQAFEVSAIDYLLKPIQIEKLEIAVAKLEHKLHRAATMHDRLEVLKENIKNEEIHKIALPILDGLVFVDVQHISLIEAQGSYTHVWMQDGTNILVSKKIRFFEELLEKRVQFFRVHRSNIININAIKKYSKSENFIFLDNNKSVRIARNKKNDFESYIANIRL